MNSKKQYQIQVPNLSWSVATMKNQPLNAQTFSQRIQTNRNRLKKAGNQNFEEISTKKEKQTKTAQKQKQTIFSNCKAITKYKNLEEIQMQSVQNHRKNPNKWSNISTNRWPCSPEQSRGNLPHPWSSYCISHLWTSAETFTIHQQH